MIKYLEIEAVHPEYGRQIEVIDNIHEAFLIKTASMNYSRDILDFVGTLQKKPAHTYIVVNAVGAKESWGMNSRGDRYSRSGLSHFSLRSDMGTPNDYGYKTFEYYGQLYRHHLNKPHKGHKIYGKVLFAYWNAPMDRVELVIEFPNDTNLDLVKKLEIGENIAVSIGIKVRYDRCSICDKKSFKTADYCKHLKYYLGRVVDEKLSLEWSRELGKIIPVGSQVACENDHPRGFDLSIVYLGADCTSFVLGKVADRGQIIPSSYEAEALGLTDEYFDTILKHANINKISMIDKVVETAPEQASPRIVQAITGTVDNAIDAEPEIPSSVLDHLMKFKTPNQILTTMMGMGISPKPSEFQRIIIIGSFGDKELANSIPPGSFLSGKNPLSDIKSTPELDKQSDAFFNPEYFDEDTANMLNKYAASRSYFHENFDSRLSTAINNPIEKIAEQVEPGGELDAIMRKGVRLGHALFLLYYMAASKNIKFAINPESVSKAMSKLPYIKASLISAPIAGLIRTMPDMRAAAHGGNLDKYKLQDDPFLIQSGLQKQAGLITNVGAGIGVAGLSIPALYVMRAYNQNRAMRGQASVRGTGFLSSSPIRGAAALGAGVAFGPGIASRIGRSVSKSAPVMAEKARSGLARRFAQAGGGIRKRLTR